MRIYSRWHFDKEVRAIIRKLIIGGSYEIRFSDNERHRKDHDRRIRMQYPDAILCETEEDEQKYLLLC